MVWLLDEQAAQQILNEIVIQGDEVHWDDVSGLEVAKSALKETVVYPFLRPDLFMGLREPARGMLLFGPPGTGKTLVVRALAKEAGCRMLAVQPSDVMDMVCLSTYAFKVVFPFNNPYFL